MRYIVPLLLLCCLMLSSGCASLYGVYDDQRLSGTITEDKEISLGIKSDLMDANLSQGWGIKVYCYYGHVFLVGEAPEKMRSQAIRIARLSRVARSALKLFREGGEERNNAVVRNSATDVPGCGPAEKRKFPSLRMGGEQARIFPGCA